MEKTIYSADYARLRQWLREKRKEKGLTMRETGERIGVIHSWIGKVELGERRLDVVEYVRYCEALEVDPHEGVELVTRQPAGKKLLLVAESGPEYKVRKKHSSGSKKGKKI